MWKVENEDVEQPAPKRTKTGVAQALFEEAAKSLDGEFTRNDMIDGIVAAHAHLQKLWG